MTKLHKIIFALLFFSLSTIVAAPAPVVFSSAYTHLAKDCKWAYKESQLTEGQDNALICTGVGPYQIFIYFSASDAFLVVQHKKTNQNLNESVVGGIDWQHGVVEWCMANKKVFAIIVRNKVERAEFLQVHGLEKFFKITGSIKTKNNLQANVQARNLADNAYLKLR